MQTAFCSVLRLLKCLTLISLTGLFTFVAKIPEANAFWLLNFQTAATMPTGALGFIGGTGGQFTSVGSPANSSFTPFLAHAGIRYGLSDHVDIGYRLCTVPLPYSSAGPSLGAEIDIKVRLMPTSSAWQVSLVGGIGYSYLLISDQTKNAWSPGIDLILTHPISEGLDLSWNARYVYTAIPSASGGSGANNVQARGGSMGIRIALTSNVSLLPEIGIFDFVGSLSDKSLNGWGAQYGAVLSARLF